MIYDISMKINEEMMVYKNKEDKKIKRMVVSSFETGSFYESEFSMNIHTGTHVDAPLHMIKGGKSIDELSLDLFYGRALVVDVTHVNERIECSDVDCELFKGYEYILFKTRNSFENEFNPNFVYVSEDVAQCMVDAGCKGVGLDALSIEQSANHHKTHHVFLGNGLVILEGIRLAEIEAREYQISCFPLYFDKAEGSMVRAVLMDEK